MARLITKIKLYLKANGKVYRDEVDNFVCQNDVPDGTYKPEQDYIKSWNVSGLAEPTAEQLATYDNDSDTFETNATIDNKRINAYGDWKDQLDEIYHNIDDWKIRIKSIKDSNPKN